MKKEPVIQTIDTVIRILKREITQYAQPSVTTIARKRDPFCVLISCLLSLRTKDKITAQASARLFALADTPEALSKLSNTRIEKAIYPVGFYKTKAVRIREICQTLLDDHHSRVPDTIEALLKLKGVGRKTANLVITLGFNKPGICVDTHVHRISNRLGMVTTKNPDQTEFALRKILPRQYWIIYNDLLVTWGQNICRPISPFCSTCAIQPYCPQISVTRHR